MIGFKQTGQEIIENGIILKEWKSMLEDKLNEIKADALLSSVLEICAPRVKDFQAGLSYV